MIASRLKAVAARGGRAQTPRASAADAAYCRRVLPRVSRTFAINIRLLSGSLGDAVRIAYLLCRIADTLEDAWGGSRAEIERRFDLLLAAVSGDGDAAVALGELAARNDSRFGVRGAEEPALSARARAAEAEHRDLVVHTPRVWRCFMSLDRADRALVAEAVSVLARGMRRTTGRAAADAPPAHPFAPVGRAAHAMTPWNADEAELRQYCWIVAGCIGVMLTGLVARRSPGTPGIEARRLMLAPAVGEGLQLTNILLDWPHDVRRGRCYLPGTWLAEEGLAPEDLVGRASPGVERIAARLERRALEALDTVPDYLAAWPASQVRYRQFCLWPSLWALVSLGHARSDPQFPWGEHRPRVPRATLWRVALAAVARGHRDEDVRALFRRLRPGSAAARPERPPGP